MNEYIKVEVLREPLELYEQEIEPFQEPKKSRSPMSSQLRISQL